MDLDLRGMTTKERKELLKWFFLESPAFKIKGCYAAYKYLQTLPPKDKDFVEKALHNILEDDDGEEEPIGNLADLGNKKIVVDGYS